MKHWNELDVMSWQREYYKPSYGPYIQPNKEFNDSQLINLCDYLCFDNYINTKHFKKHYNDICIAIYHIDFILKATMQLKSFHKLLYTL